MGILIASPIARRFAGSRSWPTMLASVTEASGLVIRAAAHPDDDVECAEGREVLALGNLIVEFEHGRLHWFSLVGSQERLPESPVADWPVETERCTYDAVVDRE